MAAYDRIPPPYSILIKMLGRLKEILPQFDFQAARRFSAQVSSKLTLSFLVLGSAARIPWEKLLGGRIPAGLTSLLSITAYIFKGRQAARETSQAASPLIQQEHLFTTKRILRHLRRNKTRTHAYLAHLKLPYEESQQLLQGYGGQGKVAILLPLLFKISNAIQNPKSTFAQNLWNSTAHGLSRFNELLLLKTYSDFEIFSGLELSWSNVLCLLVLLNSLFCGYQDFHSRQEKSQKPTLPQLWKIITDDYENFQESNSSSSPEMSPLLSI